ncbi:MAG: late competence development ComFB family protein [Oscillatoriales cyanobacterium SM2_2_1]|nr:late competence development ComFB family protein [Oscillatoriales cyanobacterium SM2_2_1]
MFTCRNVLVDLVLQEIYRQIERSPLQDPDLAVSEVAAYALNRLPAMYATSCIGWARQRQRAIQDHKVQVESVVRSGLITVQRDTLRAVDPLPDRELEHPARSLRQLAELLRCPQMTWLDIPPAVAQSLVAASRVMAAPLSHPRALRGQPRSASRRYLPRVEQTEERTYQNFLANISFGFSNVLEKLVLSLVYHQIHKMDLNAISELDLTEITAYVLNRLPPMYATTQRGYSQLRKRARELHGRFILDTIAYAILLIMERPYRDRELISEYRLLDEQQQAITQLSWMLHRDDVTWRNVVVVVKEAIAAAEKGTLIWRSPAEYPL